MATFFLILNWILFLLIFMMAGHFLRLAYMVGRKQRHDLIRDWRGRPVPVDRMLQRRFIALNLVAAPALLADGFATVLLGLPPAVWSGICGLILWLYFTTLHLMCWRARQAASSAA